MDSLPFDQRGAIYLLIALGWTTLFSLTSKYPWRGLRNFGILACYILAIAMFVRAGFVTSIVTWCAFGIAAAVVYSFYLWIAYARDKSPDKKIGISLSLSIHGLLAWPVMIPEAIEYLLAEFGVLRVQHSSPAAIEDAASRM